MPPRLSKEPTVRYVFSMPKSSLTWLAKQGAKSGVSAAEVLRGLVDKAKKAG